MIYFYKPYKNSAKTYHIYNYDNNITQTSDLIQIILNIPIQQLFKISIKLRIPSIIFPDTKNFPKFTEKKIIIIYNKESKLYPIIETFTKYTIVEHLKIDPNDFYKYIEETNIQLTKLTYTNSFILNTPEDDNKTKEFHHITTKKCYGRYSSKV